MTLQQLMLTKGVTQLDLSKELKLSESHISLMVTGKRRMTLGYAAVFAKKLDVSIDDIFLALDFTNRENEKTSA